MQPKAFEQVTLHQNFCIMNEKELHMETGKKDERYFSVYIERSLPLTEQLHEANTIVCNEAGKDESVFLEWLESRNGHIHLLYRLRRMNDKRV
jgi:hypothetical protein